MPSTAGHFYGQSPVKSPAQIPAGKSKMTQAILGMESKALGIHGTAGTMLRLTWYLSPAMSPLSPDL